MENRTLISSLVSAFVLAIFVLLLAGNKLAQAQVPFWGIVGAPVPMIPAPPPAVSPPVPPLCPAHFPIKRNIYSISPYMGLYFLPGASFQYKYSQFFTGSTLFYAFGKPGVNIVGKFSPVPYITCTTPYPVFPSSIVIDRLTRQPVYQIGNSLESR